MTCEQCKYITVCMVQADCFGQIFDPNYDGEHGCTDFAPRTNADRIRSMTDEELADFFRMFCCGMEDCADCQLHYEDCPGSGEFSAWINWLQQTAETPKEEAQ